MALLTKPGTCVWEVVRNALETSVRCSRQFSFCMKKNAKPLSRKAAVTLKKKTFDTSSFGLLIFSAVNRYTNYFHPSADYLPILLNQGFMTPVLGCARMAMTTPGRGYACGEVSLTFCHVPGSRSGEWGTWGHRRTHLPARTALAAPTFVSHLRKGRAAGWRARMFWVWTQPAFDAAVS